jgi:PKD domain-containing protein
MPLTAAPDRRMGRLRESLVLAVLLVPGLVQSTAATVDPELAKGIAQVKQGEYELGVLTLDSFVRKVADPAARADEVSEALLYLGAAYVHLGEEPLARGKFRDALARRADLSAEGRGLSDKVLTLFNTVRDEMRSAAPRPSMGGLAIDHQQIGCVVAGRFSVFNARVQPQEALARGRLFFHADANPGWYFVEMKPQAGALSAALPQARKTTKRINYYIEVIDRSSVTTRTQEYAPAVVGSEAECSRAMPVAAFSNAPGEIVVTAGPGAPPLPVGFDPIGLAAGAAGPAPSTTAAAVKAGSSATKIFVIAGGVALAGGVAAVAAGGGGDGGTTATTPRQTTPTVAAATTTTTTLPPPASNRAPDVSCRTNPASPEGTAPLRITFNCCTTRDPENDVLTYRFEFGDGDLATGTICGPRDHTYLQGNYTARICVTDGFAGHEACPAFDIRARPATAPPDDYVIGWANRITIESDLKLAGGLGQIVVNSQLAFFPGEGRADLVVPMQAMNYVEAVVVRGQGRPGTWRLRINDLVNASPAPTIRAIAGDVLSASADTIVFRLTGQPGQRIVVAFAKPR